MYMREVASEFVMQTVQGVRDMNHTLCIEN